MPFHSSRHITRAGSERRSHIFSAAAYAGGTWLYLEVGTEQWNDFWSNDVSICSAMTMRWFLEHVHVRSTGEGIRELIRRVEIADSLNWGCLAGGHEERWLRRLHFTHHDDYRRWAEHFDGT